MGVAGNGWSVHDNLKPLQRICGFVSVILGTHIKGRVGWHLAFGKCRKLGLGIMPEKDGMMGQINA